MKVCTVCKQSKELDCFYANKRSADGKGYRCKACDAATRRVSRARASLDSATKRGYRDRRYKRVFGITLADYESMLVLQGGVCGICGTTNPTGEGGSGKHLSHFAVDHCHATGRVRGLLCNSCNRGLGMFKDSAEMLRRAAKYVDCH